MATAGAAAQRATPAHVGSETCAACHADEMDAWRRSHHQLAWTLPTQATVLGDFDDAEFVHDDIATHFRRTDDKFIIETEGADGSTREFTVAGVAGIAPLQQYLVETEPGRLQSFDVAWDANEGRWYHLYPDQQLPPGDGLHWTGPYKNWNARCAECHATGFAKNYDLQTRTYASQQAELGVGCEACHGPAEAHLQWADGPEEYEAPIGIALSDVGLTVDYLGQSPGIEINQCAGCHARREPFGDGNPVPGTAFHDAYRLSLLREGLYHVDGTILDEVYVYGSFLQSKMYQNGVRCTDCHDPHKAELKFQGNSVCTQCHSSAANPRFPTLRSADYDTPTHHFHEQGSEAAACKACHMVERTYMGIDGRRDHSFRIPRPDVSVDTGAPNACVDCHEDRDAKWAAAELAKRFPDSDNRGPHAAEVFALARANPSEAAEALFAVADDTELPEIIRATALDLLVTRQNEADAMRAAAHLDDPHPLIREAAVALQQSAPPDELIERLAPLLSDPARSVRLAAARAILPVPPEQIPNDSVAYARAAMGEWRASLMARADFPETHLVLGGAALVTRNFNAAEAAFSQVVQLDPQRADAWQMIVRLRAAMGDHEGARTALAQGLSAIPGDQTLLSMQRELTNQP